MLNKIFLLIFFYFSINISDVCAQKNIFVSVNTNFGLILPHHNSFYYFVGGSFFSHHIQVGVHSSGNKQWQKEKKYPDMGIGLFYSNLGGNETLGNASALYSFFQASIFDFNKAGIKYDFSLGLCRSSNPFDIQNNLYNIAIGSKYNAFVKFGLGAYFMLSPKIRFSPGISFVHFSNGASAMPNKGINIINMKSALSYSFNNEKYKGEAKSFEPNLYLHQFYATLSAGYHENLKPEGNKFFVSSLALDYIYKPKNKNGFGAGIDFFYDKANQAVDAAVHEESSKRVFYSDIHASYFMYYGRTVFFAQIGPYIIKPAAPIGVFTRIGLKYNFAKHIFGNISLKTYFSNADFIEWGIGYNFYK